MRVLSVLEPWASLIAQGVKVIETRSWATRYRGELYIHASRKALTTRERAQYGPLLALLGDTDFRYGCIIARCRLAHCRYMDEALIEAVRANPVEHMCGGYSVGRYAWMLEAVEPLTTPIPARGMLGIWRYEA